MKKYIVLLFALPMLLCCSSDDFTNNNPYLPGYNFNIPIDLSLPIYNPLLYTANPVVLRSAEAGINGIIIMNTGSGYVAYENTCPNQAITTCSVLQLDGILAKCPCDDVEYNLFTGQPTTPAEYGLKTYRVEMTSSSSLRVYN